ncbi:MAG: hypothetical protein WDN49_28010 [Acetobacteraceae bacterium]
MLLGLLMMITRRNAFSQVIGFLCLENGTSLAAIGVKGMPLVIESRRGSRTGRASPSWC